MKKSLVFVFFVGFTFSCNASSQHFHRNAHSSLGQSGTFIGQRPVLPLEPLQNVFSQRDKQLTSAISRLCMARYMGYEGTGKYCEPAPKNPIEMPWLEVYARALSADTAAALVAGTAALCWEVEGAKMVAVLWRDRRSGLWHYRQKEQSLL